MQIYNIAVICLQRNQMHCTHEALTKCFDHVEELFFYDSAASCAGMYMYMYVQITTNFQLYNRFATYLVKSVANLTNLE